MTIPLLSCGVIGNLSLLHFCVGLQMSFNWLLGEFILSVAARSCNEIVAKKRVFEKAIEKGVYFCMNAVLKASLDGESRDMTSLLWWYHFLREQSPHLSIAFLRSHP